MGPFPTKQIFLHPQLGHLACNSCSSCLSTQAGRSGWVRRRARKLREQQQGCLSFKSLQCFANGVQSPCWPFDRGLFIEAAGHRECVCQVGYQRASFLPAAACHMTSGMMNFLAFSWMVLIGLLQAGWDGSVVDMAMGSSTSGRSCGWNQAAVHHNE